MKNSKSVVLLIVTCIMLLLGGCDNKDVSSETPEVSSDESGGIFDQITANPNIEAVKNGLLPQYSNSVTVGNALDHWKGCNNPTWEAETTERGEKLVKFSCDVNKNPEPSFCDKYASSMINAVEIAGCEAEKITLQHLVKQQQGIVFSLSADGTSFVPESYVAISTFDDGKKDKRDYTSLVDSFLNQAYSNEPIYINVNNSDYKNRQ